MWRKYVMLGVACAFGVMLLTHSAWAADPTLTEEFKTEWQAAQVSLVGKWNQIMVYDARTEVPDGKYWRVCELIIEEGGNIKRGKYVEHDGDTVQITGGELVHVPGVAIEGYLETKNGEVYCVDTGGVDDGSGNKRWMTLKVYPGECIEFVLQDMKLELQELSMANLNAKAVRNFLARHSVDVDRAFPNMTVDGP
jgi:hypothetical protein